MKPFRLLFVVGLLGVSVTLANATTGPNSSTQWTDRLIIQLNQDEVETIPDNRGGRRVAMAATRARQLSVSAGTIITPRRLMSGGAHVMSLPESLPENQVEAIAARLRRDPAVASVQPDYRHYPKQAVAINDPYFWQQWNLAGPTAAVTGPFQGSPLAANVGGVNFAGAFNANRRGQGVRIAVIDSGIVLGNRDLIGRIAPYNGSFNAATGFDFVSNNGGVSASNDGDDRDNNPTDPGNWLTASESVSAQYLGCLQRNSTWHGTQMAGIIGANANNGADMVGIAPAATLVAVRVLGKCGGYLSDIADGIRWAAGLAVPGVPANTTPAQVLNLSLGSERACTPAHQSAIDDALLRGSAKAIVAAAGNEDGTNVNNGVAPGGCDRVITVTAHDRNGIRPRYANIGGGVELSAPGGVFCTAQPCDNTIVSISNTGTTAPVADSVLYSDGTSAATAHVTAIAAVALSANPNLGRGQLALVLINSARPHPASGNCTATTCGRGMVDATAAAQLALNPPAEPADWTGFPHDPVPWSISQLEPSSGSVSAIISIVGTGFGWKTNDLRVSFSGSSSAAAIASVNSNGTRLSVQVPPGARSGPITIAKVSTGESKVSAASFSVTQAAAPVTTTTTPAGADSGGGGGGGGGCALSSTGSRPDATLALLVLAAAGFLFRRRAAKRLRLRLGLGLAPRP